MFKIISLIVFSSIVLLSVPSIWADSDSLVLTVNSQAEIKPGQQPTVSGIVTDSEGNPIADVDIQVNFPSRTILKSTNSQGEFEITSPVPAESGEYTVIVSATNDRLFVDTSFTYTVIDRQAIILQSSEPINLAQKTKDGSNSTQPEKVSLLDIAQKITAREQMQPTPSLIGAVSENNNPQPLATNNIPPQLTAPVSEKPIKTASTGAQDTTFTTQNTNNVDEDLKVFQKQFEANTPRNAFLKFLEDIDSSVKNIFWGQFLFTEKITQNGLDAKQKAINEGKSPQEATQMFQQAAATKRSTIIAHNAFLNIEHGNATADVQNQFDEKGKLPRNN